MSQSPAKFIVQNGFSAAKCTCQQGTKRCRSVLEILETTNREEYYTRITISEYGTFLNTLYHRYRTNRVKINNGTVQANLTCQDTGSMPTQSPECDVILAVVAKVKIAKATLPLPLVVASASSPRLPPAGHKR